LNFNLNTHTTAVHFYPFYHIIFTFVFFVLNECGGESVCGCALCRQKEGKRRKKEEGGR